MCDKLTTFNTHMKTNHMYQSDKSNKYGNKHNFHCDKCDLGFNKKKDQKKHKEDAHNTDKASNVLKHNEGNTIRTQETACKCTAKTVCDWCL